MWLGICHPSSGDDWCPHPSLKLVFVHNLCTTFEHLKTHSGWFSCHSLKILFVHNLCTTFPRPKVESSFLHNLCTTFPRCSLKLIFIHNLCTTFQHLKTHSGEKYNQMGLPPFFWFPHHSLKLFLYTTRAATGSLDIFVPSIPQIVLFWLLSSDRS